MDIIRGLRKSGFWLVKLILIVLWSDGMRFSSNALSKFLFIELTLTTFTSTPSICCHSMRKLTYHHQNPNLKSKIQKRIPKFQIPNFKLQIPSVHRLVPMCGGPTAQMVVRRRGAAHSCYPEPAPLQPRALISLWNVGFLDGIRISRCLFWIFDLLVNPHLGSEARIISNQIAKL